MAKKKQKTSAEITAIKEWAKGLYINEKLTQKEIAERTEMSTNTISKWVNEGNWDAGRKSILMTWEEQLRNMVNELEKLNQDISNNGRGYADKEQAYIRDTLVQNINKLKTDVTVEEIWNVYRKAMEYWRPIDLDIAKQLTEFFDPFIKANIK
ncbi:DDE transposase family protein [Pedobacter zeae]|uniref:Transcriptional regulator with XRE-family HTH domain n=1 Tax=Pedobacter zeae TaxID=1737356 RepID=A0A7W6P562_9SPHI|nr:DDE transposase family protein [Pedobacter zeae]MBB4106626.1 transcriptional regulator with XRE-family HTH domain [Pedobacter zeae]GGH02789.1 hypothetical protein GCM10007422_17460 [Pedobacter zeae]